jgi:predicted O-linked N-acetylglucosamine transferase (SPINDLY family)
MFDWLRRAKPAPVPSAARSEEAASTVPSPPPAPPPAPTPAPAPSDPALARSEFQRATQALARGDKAAAEQHLRQAVAAQPEHVDAMTNLGALLKDSQRPDEAERILRRALATDGRAGVAAFNLAWLLMDRRQWTEAATWLRTAAAVMPKDADVHCFLGNALMGQGDADGARRAYQAAIRHNARHARARWGLAMAQLPAIAATVTEQARAPQAFAQELGKLKAWFRAQPTIDGSGVVGAQQPYYLAYVEADHRAVLREYGTLCASLMGAWARRAGVPAPAAGTGPKWKLGIVSSHVVSHSVWHALLRGWVEHLDATRFEIHLFHTGPGRDAETDWAARHVARLHQSVGDWKAWARCIADQRLDAIIYPEIGMDTTTTRLAALRLARLQLAAWGHPITSGLPTMDGYLSAEAFEPEGAAAHYVEPLVALPRLGCCYQPYGTAPARVDFARAGIGANDRVLLCPGTAFKYTPQHDSLWIEIARRCAPCKLVFFRPEGSSLADQLEERLRAAFSAAGVDADAALCFLPWQSQAAFFAWLDRADVFLDTPGFSGFNTVMQALERGTPVVAWEGLFMRGRFASGVLRQAGLGAWVATDAAGYVDRVERLCGDEALRRQVRREVAAAAALLYRDRAGVDQLARYLEQRLAQG